MPIRAMLHVVRSSSFALACFAFAAAAVAQGSERLTFADTTKPLQWQGPLPPAQFVDGGRKVELIDDAGRLRADYKEMAPEVQGEVVALWPQVTNENLYEISDLAGYKADFLRLFGFGVEGVDYDADVATDVKIPNLVEMA